MVLLHGFGAFHGVWDGIISRFSSSIRTIAYDLPGHGGSIAIPGNKPSATARMIVADLDARDVRHAHLVGHSMGGAIATLIALANPGLVASLTLLAPGGFGKDINCPLLRRYALAVSQEDIGACLAAMSATGFDVAKEKLDRMERMRAFPGQTEILVEIAAAITRNERQGEIPRDAISGLKVPVRLLWGDADPVLPFIQSVGWPSRFVMLRAEGAGHMLIEERPDMVTALLASAMATSTSPGNWA